MYYDTEDNKPPRSIFFIALLHHLRGPGSEFRWPPLHFLNREMRDEILHVRLHKRGHLHRCSILHGNLQQVLCLDRSENPHNCPVVLVLNSHSFNAYQLLEAQFVDQTARSQNPNRWRVRLRHSLELLSFLFGCLSDNKLGVLADASSTHQDHTSERWGLDVSPYRGGFYFHDGLGCKWSGSFLMYIFDVNNEKLERYWILLAVKIPLIILTVVFVQMIPNNTAIENLAKKLSL